MFRSPVRRRLAPWLVALLAGCAFDSGARSAPVARDAAGLRTAAAPMAVAPADAGARLPSFAVSPRTEPSRRAGASPPSPYPVMSVAPRVEAPARAVEGACPPPEYPRASRLRGEEGLVLLDATVSAQGTVDGIRVASSSGHPPLDAAASSAVAAWRFVPASIDGGPVPATVRIPIRFRLER